ncbi:MAG: hypothetical protein AB1696_24640 [Planctomycetota bacterium]
MRRATVCAGVLLVTVFAILAQENIDPGVEQSRRMPRGRRSRNEVTGADEQGVSGPIPDPARVTPISSAQVILPENTPFPPRGFAKGTVTVVGDDSGPMGTYRLAFKDPGSGQAFPFIECKMFEAFENYLAEHGPEARRGKVVVEVKGYVTTYRDTNFLFLHDYRMPKGTLPGGGTPAGKGSATTKPQQ